MNPNEEYRLKILRQNLLSLPVELSHHPLTSLRLIEPHQRAKVSWTLTTAAHGSNTDTVLFSFGDSRVAACRRCGADTLDANLTKSATRGRSTLGCSRETLVPVCIEAYTEAIRVACTGAASAAEALVAFASERAVCVAGRIKWAASAYAVEADEAIAALIAAAATVGFVRGWIEASAVAKNPAGCDAGWRWGRGAGERGVEGGGSSSQG
jgi:hypothetical protein